MLSQDPIPPDARLQCFHRSPYHQMPPDVTQYHQMPDCNAFTGPDTTRCQTAMLSQVPIPPDATRCNPIPPDARLQCFHRARYHQMTDCNAFTGPHTTRCHQMLSQGQITPDASRCFHRARYRQMPTDAFTGPDTTSCQTAMLSQVPITPDARLQCFHRARYHQIPYCNAFTGPYTTR